MANKNVKVYGALTEIRMIFSSVGGFHPDADDETFCTRAAIAFIEDFSNAALSGQIPENKLKRPIDFCVHLMEEDGKRMAIICRDENKPCVAPLEYYPLQNEWNRQYINAINHIEFHPDEKRFSSRVLTGYMKFSAFYNDHDQSIVLKDCHP